MDIKIRKAGLFTVLTFLVSYFLIRLYSSLGGTWTFPGSLIISVIYMFVPATVAIFVQRKIYGIPLKAAFGISFRINRWFLVAWLFPLILAAGAIGVSLLHPGIEYAPELEAIYERFEGMLSSEQVDQMRAQVADLPIHPFWIVLLQGLVAGITINAAVALGEELGWRGFLHQELTYLGFWKSSTLIGIIWGLWHFPLILKGHNYPQHPVAGVAMMTLFCVLLSPLFAYVRIRANSVVAAAVMHGSLNATGGLAILPIRGGNDLTVGITGLAGLIVLVLANLALFAYDRFYRKSPVPLPTEGSATRWKADEKNRDE